MVGAHQSGHNSGVMHAGLSYAPGSLKARLAAAGLRQMLSFCVEHAIPHEVCGKLVVAADESQVAPLRGLHTRGQANGLRGLVWARDWGLTGIEPHAVGAGGLLVPDEGIVDYRLVCAALVRCIHGWAAACSPRRPSSRCAMGRGAGRRRRRAGSWRPAISSIAPACNATGSPPWLASGRASGSSPSGGTISL